jgi:Flp pilus assembly protein TadD
MNEVSVFKEILELYQTDHPAAALELINETIGEDSSAAMYFFSAMLHIQSEKKDESIELLKTALDKYPNYRKAAEKLGILQATEGRFAEAKVNLLKTLSLDHDDRGGAIHGLLGLCYLKTGDAATAEYNYRIARKKDPEKDDWRKGLEESLKMQGKKRG